MYAKIFTSLWDGSLRGKSDQILVFVNMLSQADSAGFVDRHFVAMAEETGLPVERVRRAIGELEAPDPDSRSTELSGARLERIDSHRDWGWRIINHGHYRALATTEEQRDQNRLRQQQYRDGTSSPPQTPLVPSTGTDSTAGTGVQIQKHRVTQRHAMSQPKRDIGNPINLKPEIGLPQEVELWHRICPKLPGIRNWTPKRQSALIQRRKDTYWTENLEAAMKLIAASEFCNGTNNWGWKAKFSWLLQPETVTKVMEGDFENREIKPQRRGIKMPTDAEHAEGF